jgi:hypothetical protein
MKIRPIKPEHITNCIYCKVTGKKVQAVWHLTGANKQACDEHKHKLVEIITAEHRGNDDHLSEADYQTWMKL